MVRLLDTGLHFGLSAAPLVCAGQSVTMMQGNQTTPIVSSNVLFSKPAKMPFVIDGPSLPKPCKKPLPAGGKKSSPLPKLRLKRIVIDSSFEYEASHIPAQKADTDQRPVTCDPSTSNGEDSRTNRAIVTAEADVARESSGSSFYSAVDVPTTSQVDEYSSRKESDIATEDCSSNRTSEATFCTAFDAPASPDNNSDAGLSTANERNAEDGSTQL